MNYFDYEFNDLNEEEQQERIALSLTYLIDVEDLEVDVNTSHY